MLIKWLTVTALVAWWLDRTHLRARLVACQTPEIAYRHLERRVRFPRGQR